MKIDKKIGVFYPAAFPQKEKMADGLSNIRNIFSEVITYQEPDVPYRYLAKKPGEMLDEFLHFVQNEKTDFLIAARGGAGSLFLVNQLNNENIDLPKKKKKMPVTIGFSDLTALFWYLWKQHNTPSIYVPVVAYHFARFTEWKTSGQFIELIQGKTAINLSDFGQPEILFRKNNFRLEEGIILPVCLSVFAECAEDVETEDNFILIFEDINEKAYKIERYMNVLEYKGILNNTSVIILGNIQNMDKPEWLNEIMKEFAQKYNITLISGLNFGHHLNSVSLPFGVKGNIDISNMQLSWKEFLV